MADRNSGELVRLRVTCSELVGEVRRGRGDPVTLAEFDRLRLIRDERTLQGPTHGTLTEPGRPGLISAVEIIEAAQQAKERMRLARELEG